MEFAVTFFQMGVMSLLGNELLVMMDFSSTPSELAALGHLYDQFETSGILLTLEMVSRCLTDIPDHISRPYAVSFVSHGGVNRIVASNWIEKYPAELYRELFRFEKSDILVLIASVELPDILQFENGYQSNSLEAIHILLRRLAAPCRWTDLCMEFDLRPQYLSVIFNNTVMLLFKKWGNFIRSLDHSFLDRNHLEIYAEAFQLKGCPLADVVFTIDGTKQIFCRPGHGLQNAAYCGHHHQHCLGYQFIELPTGINIVMGPYNGFEHDSTSVKMIRLEEKLTDLLDFTSEGGVAYKVFLDSGYALGNTFITPFSRRRALSPEERRFNREMSSVRQPSEWGIGRVKALFAFLEFKRNLRVLQMPLGAMFLVAVHLKNIHSTLYGSQTASYFGLPTLSLMEYLGLQ